MIIGISHKWISQNKRLCIVVSRNWGTPNHWFPNWKWQRTWMIAWGPPNWRKKPQIISSMFGFTPEISTRYIYIYMHVYVYPNHSIPLYLIMSHCISLYRIVFNCILHPHIVGYTPIRYPHKMVGPVPIKYPTNCIPSKDSGIPIE